ncbi:hypothetical protein ARMSODRAFT_968137 [Armillaria solidipes]|uniref:Uncharacterized protein n=1 Tax=Armillaria solidipes TaxID=1076256 RepID=A0A2H3C948_9AGAR|nr:hypothetical protein ARMSODRAFT_968137 [Armillaria solidipes]
MSTGGSSRNIPSLPPPRYCQYPGSDRGTTPLVIIRDRHRVTVPWDIVLQGLYDAPTLEEHIDQLLLLDAYRTTNTLLGYEGVDIVIPACYFGQLIPFIETLELPQPVKVWSGRAFRGETPTATLCLAFVLTVFLWYLAFCLRFCYLHSLSEAIHTLGLANKQQVKVLSAFFAQAISSICHGLLKGVLAFYVIVVYIRQGIAYVYCEGAAKLLQALLPQAEEEGWLLYGPPSSCPSLSQPILLQFFVKQEEHSFTPGPSPRPRPYAHSIQIEIRIVNSDSLLMTATTQLKRSLLSCYRLCWILGALYDLDVACDCSRVRACKLPVFVLPLASVPWGSLRLDVACADSQARACKLPGVDIPKQCQKGNLETIGSSRDDIPTPPDVVIVREKYHLCPHFGLEFGKREHTVAGLDLSQDLDSKSVIKRSNKRDWIPLPSEGISGLGQSAVNYYFAGWIISHYNPSHGNIP